MFYLRFTCFLHIFFVLLKLIFFSPSFDLLTFSALKIFSSFSPPLDLIYSSALQIFSNMCRPYVPHSLRLLLVVTEFNIFLFSSPLLYLFDSNLYTCMSIFVSNFFRSFSHRVGLFHLAFLLMSLLCTFLVTILCS